MTPEPTLPASSRRFLSDPVRTDSHAVDSVTGHSSSS
jgi:hypothetical protein